MHVRTGQALAAALAALTAACVPHPSSNEVVVANQGMKNGVAAARYLTPVALDKLAIGRSIGRDKSIQDETTTFGPQDTVYASMRISGSANSGIVRALWTDPRGEKIQDDTRIITPSAGETIDVQVKPAQGWVGGQYRLDVYLDDKLAATRNISVEAPAAGKSNEQQGVEKTNPANH